jgi:hypothetical protein
MKSQQRCCQGLIASSCSQRQIVEAEASVTPRSTTSRCSSVRVKRDSGRPCVTGSSQAIALTSATCSGGKTPRTARARFVGKSLETTLAKPRSPAADDLWMAVEPGSDLRVLRALGGIEDHPRPLHLTPGRRHRPRPPLKLNALLAAQLDHMAAPPRHDHPFARDRPPPSHNPKDFRTRLLAPRGVMANSSSCSNRGG